MDVVLVILNYRTPGLTLRALGSALPEIDRVRADEGTRGVPLPERSRIALVDNASGDDSPDQLAQAVRKGGLGDRVDLFLARENRGFGAGNNLAFRHYLGSGTPPRFFHVLNPDAALAPGALGALLRQARRQGRAGAWGSRIEELRDARADAALAFPSLTGEARAVGRVRRCPTHLSRWSSTPAGTPGRRPDRRGRAPGAEGLGVARRVDWVLGASVLLRSRALAEVGLFDEDFFLYFEDIDLCRRLRNADWEVWTVPESQVLHQGSASTRLGAPGERVPRYWFESRARYYRKHHGAAYLAAADALALAGGALDGIPRGLGRPRRRASPLEAAGLREGPAGFLVDLFADVTLRAVVDVLRPSPGCHTNSARLQLKSVSPLR